MKINTEALTSFAIGLSVMALPNLAAAAAPGDDPGTQILASVLMGIVVAGVLYNLWKTTKAYGGIIGQGVRRIGLGIIFLVIEALDRISVNFGGVGVVNSLTPSTLGSSVHDLLFLLGLFFVTMGFAKFSSVVKG